jgi:hypothetical protein
MEIVFQLLPHWEIIIPILVLCARYITDFFIIAGAVWTTAMMIDMHFVNNNGQHLIKILEEKKLLWIFFGIPVALTCFINLDLPISKIEDIKIYEGIAIAVLVVLLFFLFHGITRAQISTQKTPVTYTWVLLFGIVLIPFSVLLGSPKEFPPIGPTFIPTPTATSTATSTPTPTATSTATATPTPTATSTPTITPTPTSTPTETPDPGVLHYICEFHSIQITSPEDEHRIPQESRTKNIEGTYSQDTSGKRFVLISMDTRAGVERYWAESIVMFGTQKWTAKVHLHKGWDRPEQEIRLAVGVYYDKDNITSGIYFDGANQVPNDVVKDLVQCGSSITLIVQRSR